MLSLDNDIYSEFQKAVDSQGMTYSEVFEDLMVQFVRRINGSEQQDPQQTKVECHYDTLKSRHIKPLLQHVNGLDSNNPDHMQVVNALIPDAISLNHTLEQKLMSNPTQAAILADKPIPEYIKKQQAMLESRIRDAKRRIEEGIVTKEEDINAEYNRIEESKKQLEALPLKLSQTRLNVYMELEHRAVYGNPEKSKTPKPKVVYKYERTDDDQQTNLVPSMSATDEEVVSEDYDGEVVD